jgi:hypothetical protein
MAIGSVSNVQPIGLTADSVTLGAYERGCLAILLRVARVCADRQYLTTIPLPSLSPWAGHKGLTQGRTNDGNARKVISSALSRLEEGDARL